MTIDWEIGKEARELDEKPIKERMRVEKNSIMKLSVAFVFYFVVMVLFYFVL
jgi:hypothetical protein